VSGGDRVRLFVEREKTRDNATMEGTSSKREGKQLRWTKSIGIGKSCSRE
jgi:hypothetical protein